MTPPSVLTPPGDRRSRIELAILTLLASVVLMVAAVAAQKLGAGATASHETVGLMNVASEASPAVVDALASDRSAAGPTPAPGSWPVDGAAMSPVASSPIAMTPPAQTAGPHTFGFAMPPGDRSAASADAAPRGAAVKATPAQSESAASEPPPSDSAAPTSTTGSPTFDHRKLRKVREVTMRVTAYSPGVASCGQWADGVTASGYSVWTNGGKLVAADTDVLPFGSVISVPGYNGGKPVPVLDRGGAIRGRHIDVLFPSRQAALEWGVKKEVTVTVWAYAEKK